MHELRGYIYASWVQRPALWFLSLISKFMRAGLQSPILCELRGFLVFSFPSGGALETLKQIWQCLSFNGVSTEIIYSVPVFISSNLMAGVKSKAAHVDVWPQIIPSLTSSSGLAGPNFGQVFPFLAKCGVTGRISSLSVGWCGTLVRESVAGERGCTFSEHE